MVKWAKIHEHSLHLLDPSSRGLFFLFFIFVKVHMFCKSTLKEHLLSVVFGLSGVVSLVCNVFYVLISLNCTLQSPKTIYDYGILLLSEVIL